MKDRIAKLPTSTKSVYRLKAGGNACEWTFSAIKRNLARMNLKSKTKNSKLNFLSSSWLTKNCGMAGVSKALKIYQTAIEDTTNPVDAYKSVEWLTSLEPET